MLAEAAAPRFKPYTRLTIQQAPQWASMPRHLQEAVLVVARVMPFRTNQYVMDELIDWNNIPDDPIYPSRSRTKTCWRPRTTRSCATWCW